jgi:hypothetical protein
MRQILTLVPMTFRRILRPYFRSRMWMLRRPLTSVMTSIQGKSINVFFFNIPSPPSKAGLCSSTQSMMRSASKELEQLVSRIRIKLRVKHWQTAMPLSSPISKGIVNHFWTSSLFSYSSPITVHGQSHVASIPTLATDIGIMFLN